MGSWSSRIGNGEAVVRPVSCTRTWGSAPRPSTLPPPSLTWHLPSSLSVLPLSSQNALWLPVHCCWHSRLPTSSTHSAPPVDSGTACATSTPRTAPLRRAHPPPRAVRLAVVDTASRASRPSWFGTGGTGENRIRSIQWLDYTTRPSTGAADPVARTNGHKFERRTVCRNTFWKRGFVVESQLGDGLESYLCRRRLASGFFHGT
ncbi:uncharacterized protein IWZ02DRAFT_126934 [Phyllosticta citriasiana]|uniref:Uncharacterized protein n=1 Tax=Phyllosticta citriasiana TaxID=595635 RepID=A0ABR1KUZ0_9PEZI